MSQGAKVPLDKEWINSVHSSRMSIYEKSVKAGKELTERYGKSSSSRAAFSKRDKTSRRGTTSRGSRRYVRGR